jgi:tRNA threonylcarbamoyladenosine biosynthesis protein TsaE
MRSRRQKSPSAPFQKEARFLSRSPEETRRLGARLGEALRAGNRVLLVGPLGAGKTLFIRGLAEGLGVRDADEVVSPTFILAQRFEGRGGLAFHHVDLYRIDTLSDWHGAGLDEIAADESIVAAFEWGEKIPYVLPGASRVTIRLGRKETEREIEIERGAM